MWVSVDKPLPFLLQAVEFTERFFEQDSFLWRWPGIGALAIALVAGTGCGGRPTVQSEPAPVCIDRSAADGLFARMEKTAKVLSSAPPVDSSRSCNIERYHRGTFRFVVYKRPDAKGSELEGAVIPKQSTVKKSGACLAAAEEELQGLRLPSYDLVLSAAKKKHHWRWQDKDIGPLKWLDCRDVQSEGFLQSTIALIHELAHGLAKRPCIFFSADRASQFSGVASPKYDADFPQQFCFKLNNSGNLPKADIARIDLDVFDSDLQRKVAHFQNLYVPKNGASTFLHLVDELSAYSLSTRGLLELVRDGKVSPPFNLQPLFLFYVANYLKIVQQRTPDLYARLFAPGSEQLLKDSDSSS